MVANEFRYAKLTPFWLETSTSSTTRHQARGTKKAAVLDISSHFSAVAFLIFGMPNRNQVQAGTSTLSSRESYLVPTFHTLFRKGSHVTDPGSQRSRNPPRCDWLLRKQGHLTSEPSTKLRHRLCNSPARTPSLWHTIILFISSSCRLWGYMVASQAFKTLLL